MMTTITIIVSGLFSLVLSIYVNAIRMTFRLYKVYGETEAEKILDDEEKIVEMWYAWLNGEL